MKLKDILLIEEFFINKVTSKKIILDLPKPVSDAILETYPLGLFQTEETIDMFADVHELIIETITEDLNITLDLTEYLKNGLKTLDGIIEYISDKNTITEEELYDIHSKMHITFIVGGKLSTFKEITFSDMFYKDGFKQLSPEAYNELSESEIKSIIRLVGKYNVDHVSIILSKEYIESVVGERDRLKGLLSIIVNGGSIDSIEVKDFEDSILNNNFYNIHKLLNEIY